jgi:hypothetical protein
MRTRRSKEEIVKVLAQYRSSGLTRMEFCRRAGIPIGTMNNYCRRDSGRGFVRVELQRASPEQSPMTVVLAKDRRIEIGAAFDDAVLLRLVRVVEAA